MAKHDSVSFFEPDGAPPNPGSPFTGGGITLPGGIAVDGQSALPHR